MSHTFHHRSFPPAPQSLLKPLKGCLAAALLCLACLSAPQPGHAAELDAKRQAILTSMYQPDAVLTEQTHRDFWAGFDNSNPNDPNLPGAMARMAAALKNSLAFDQAKARSYQASIQQRKPVVDAGYEQALQDRLELLRARKLPPDNILAQDKEFRESLVPVSQGKPLDAPGGAKVRMTPALIEQLLKNLDATHVRLERLLNPVWVPVPAAGG